MSQTVVVLGASAKAERFSNRAIRALLRHGHKVIPVHPALKEIEGLAVCPSLAAIAEPVDTLTLYVGPERSEVLAAGIVALRPRRVIFNPGTESKALQQRLAEGGIPFVEACTLVMLDGGAF